MKLLYLVHQFFPDNYTGTEKFLLELAKASQRLGHQVKVVSYSFKPHSFFDQQEGDVLLKEYIYEEVPILFVRRRENSSPQYSLNPGQMLDVARQVLTREKPDVVHAAHTLNVHDFVYCAQEMGIPYLLTLTDFFLICPKVILTTSSNSLCAGPEQGAACRQLCSEIPDQTINERLARTSEILKQAARVIAPSEFLAEMFRKEHGDLNLKVIGYGVDYHRIIKNRKRYNHNDKLTFFYGGSFIQHKGVIPLLNAFTQTEGQATLKMYGSGPNEVALRQIAGRDPRIEMCGVFSADQIGEILSQVDVAIVPSVWYENTPIILLEALASNVPAIVTDLGGMTEVVSNGVTGQTFPIGDVASLRDALQSLIQNPELLNEYKENLRSRFVPSVEQIGLAYEREYLAACSPSRQ